jgi:hypothetical protein
LAYRLLMNFELHIAQIIFHEAKRVEAEMAEMSKASAPLDISISSPAAIAIEKEELNPV